VKLEHQCKRLLGPACGQDLHSLTSAEAAGRLLWLLVGGNNNKLDLIHFAGGVRDSCFR